MFKISKVLSTIKITQDKTENYTAEKELLRGRHSKNFEFFSFSESRFDVEKNYLKHFEIFSRIKHIWMYNKYRGIKKIPILNHDKTARRNITKQDNAK